MNTPPEWATHIMIHRDGETKWWWNKAKHQNVKTKDTYKSCSPVSYWESQGWIVEEVNIQLEND